MLGSLNAPNFLNINILNVSAADSLRRNGSRPRRTGSSPTITVLVSKVQGLAFYENCRTALRHLPYGKHVVHYLHWHALMNNIPVYLNYIICSMLGC